MVSILIVDSNCAKRQELSSHVSRNGHWAYVAETYGECVTLLRAQIFDVFIVNVTSSFSQGINVVREIRSASASGVIAFGEKSGDVDAVAALEAGADDFFHLPIDEVEFVARVNSLSRRILKYREANGRQDEGGGFIDSSGWITDYRRRIVITPEGREIILTRLEFELWRALVENRGRALSREQLSFSIRGREWNSNERSVDGIASRLRKKLSVSQSKNVEIQSLRGVGYRLLLRASWM